VRTDRAAGAGLRSALRAAAAAAAAEAARLPPARDSR